MSDGIQKLADKQIESWRRIMRSTIGPLAARIRVELDFIPVEERLPEEAGLYFVLDRRRAKFTVGQKCVYMDAFEGTGWCEELNDGEEGNYWSHWAEIPEVLR